MKATFSSGVVLNGGDTKPDTPPEKCGAELMRSFYQLRNQFFDIRRGRVDYDRLGKSEEYERYRTVANGLRIFDPCWLLGRKEKIAFWINLYNTIVVDAIVHYGIDESVKEVPNLFSQVAYNIGGRLYTPDDIEHGILRGNARPWFHPLKPFRGGDSRRKLVISPVDARIHFALVCGSRSCAPIDYYDPAGIYAQLEKAAESFINSSEVVIIPEQRKVLLSEIFRWYEPDFGGKIGVIDFVFDYIADKGYRRFLRGNRENLRIEYIFYDWSLNR